MKKNVFENTGFILLARQITSSDIWTKSADYLKIWIYILTEVSFKDGGITERGEGFFNIKDIAKENRCTYGTVDHCVRWLKSAGQIATRKTTRGLFIKVLAYEKYQEINSYKKQSNCDMDCETTAKQLRNNCDTILENNKHNKQNNMSKMSEEDFEKFWDLYPRKIGKKPARQKFMKINKSVLPEILKSLERQRKDWRDPQYIPHAATWINQERWQDEVSEKEPENEIVARLTRLNQQYKNNQITPNEHEQPIRISAPVHDMDVSRND